jgi:hypothetical protein
MRYLNLTATIVEILSFIVIIYMFRQFFKEKKDRELLQAAFVELLLRAFSNNAIPGIDDIVSLYHAHFGTSGASVDIYRHIYSFLERVQLRISSAHPGDIDVYKLRDRLPELRQLMNSGLVILKTEEKKVPFYGIHNPERELLEDILELTAADRNIVGVKLTRLAELVRARQDTIETLGEEKGKATKLGYLGLAGTIIFGILSVGLTIWRMIQGGK